MTVIGTVLRSRGARGVVIILGLSSLAACAGAGGPGVQDWLVPNACHAALNQALAERRVDPARVVEPAWTIQRFNNAPADPQDWPVSGYTFTGRPAQCQTGSVVVELTAQCFVNQVYGRQGCAVTP